MPEASGTSVWKYKLRQTCRGGGGGEKQGGRVEGRKGVTSGGNSEGKGPKESLFLLVL